MNFECLSKQEIEYRYRQADDKAEILKVLADLTCSTPEEVVDLLGVPCPATCIWESYQFSRKANAKIDTDAIIRLYETGLSDRQIAQKLDYSVSSVSKWRRKFGLPPHGVRPVVDFQSAMELYKAGWSDNRIARVLGTSKATISGWRHRNYLPANGNLLAMKG